MRKEADRACVKGFLRVDGRRIVNEAGEEVLLAGWGLGNWLLCEGYMWLGGSDRFDRPRRIEQVIEEVAGEEYARTFWRRFRENYVTEDDIRKMAEMGYNSVRIPINARLFLREGPGVQFEEEGFALLDRVIDWCEKYRVYAFIDLHGAPGGQTGANIDDCIDDVSRLFVDRDQFDKGLALWERIAERYADRWIVGGYDLLNEPIRPIRFEGDISLEHLVPRLIEFYEKCIERIRRHDKRHIVSLEGHHWASETGIFTHVYDPQMVIHFHRYGCTPDYGAFREFVELSERLNVPLWLGETGENTMQWFTAMIPLCMALGVGFNMWPWKKMNCKNSPCSVKAPKEWSLLIDYSEGGAHPGYEKARAMLDEYLNNMLLDNCEMNDTVYEHLFRTPGCTIRGTDFDELPGAGMSYRHVNAYPSVQYRENTGMQLCMRGPKSEKRFMFDGDWHQYLLRLSAGEFACYSLGSILEDASLEMTCYGVNKSEVEIYRDDQLLGRFGLAASQERQTIAGLKLQRADACVIRIAVTQGAVDVDSLSVRKG